MIDWAVFATFVVSCEFLEKKIMEQREKERQKALPLGEWLCFVERILEEEIIDWRLLKRDKGREREREIEGCLVFKLITFHTSRKERDTFSLTRTCIFAFLNHLPTLFSQLPFGFAIISKSDFVLSIVCTIKAQVSHYLYTLFKKN